MIHWLLLVYMLLICMASFAGGVVPLRLTHAATQFAVSFVAGVMLGVGFLHMIPEALNQFGDTQRAMLSVLSGFLLMFFIQRYLAVHQHVAAQGQTATEHQCGVSDEIHHHAHEDLPVHLPRLPTDKQMSGLGVALGLSLHSLLNGVALAVSFEAQWNVAWFAGGATFLAILVHKPFDSLTITTLMTAEGWSTKACHIVNLLFALAIPAGVTLFYMGLRLGGQQRAVLGGALGVSAGVFICIAASDLLPEMHFHAHDRGKLSFWLLVGIALAFVVGAIGH
jgi:zinc and cadmium transporter